MGQLHDATHWGFLKMPYLRPPRRMGPERGEKGSRSLYVALADDHRSRLQSEQSPSVDLCRESSAKVRSDLETGQPPPPSQLAASQRPYRVQLSRAKRKLHGEAREKGALYFLQMFTAYLQFLGKQYSASGQDPLIFFETKDLVSTRNWKAVSAVF
jgi:hypothetical protein